MSLSRALVIACLGAVTARADAPDDLRRGDDALARFDLPAAIAAYRQATAVTPTSYEATWKLARALCDQGTLTTRLADQKPLYREAEALARAAVRLQETDARGHTTLAVAVGKLALFEGGKRKVQLSKEVKTAAARALELDPRDDLAYHVLGIWNRELSELNWVLKKFAEMLYGRFPPATMENAVAYLKQAADLAPHVIPHRVELGITYVHLGNWKQAEAELAHALAMPKAWVTDDHYKRVAKDHLEKIKPRLR